MDYNEPTSVFSEIDNRDGLERANDVEGLTESRSSYLR